MVDKKAPNSDLIRSELEDNDESEADSIKPDIPKGDPITVAQIIIKRIRESPDEDSRVISFYLQHLSNLYTSQPENNNLFFLMLEGFSEAANYYNDDLEADYLTSILDKIFSIIDLYLENDNRLAAISDALLNVLLGLVKNEFFDELEEYVVTIVNKSIDNPNNIFLRTAAAEATIIAIRGFGDDWNFEKTKEFDIILKGLLPPNDVTGFLAGILLKGLSEEIDCYGDMHEFSSMKRTIKLMKDLFSQELQFDDESFLYFTKGLVHAINWFGEAEDYEAMMEALEDLTILSDSQPQNIEVKLAFGNGLRIALDHCGIMEDLDNATKLAKRLLQLADDLPENKKIQSVAIMGVFKAATWAGVFWETGLVNALMTSVEKIYLRFPDDAQIKILLGRGLFNLTKELCLINKQKMMTKIVDELSKLHQKNLDIIELAQFYSQSLVNMLYLLSEFSDNFEEIYSYLNESEKLAIKYQEDEIISVSFSKALVNVIRALGLYGKINEMESTLDVLRDYTISSENFDVLLRLGKGYVDAIKAYGDLAELHKINPILVEIKEWIEDDPTNIDLQIILAKTLVNTISSYGKNNKITEMNLYLDELREIIIHFPAFNTIQVQLAKGLSHAIRWYVKQEDLMRSVSLLHEMRSISIDFADEIEIHEMLARSTRRILFISYKLEKYELVEELLESLRKQLKKFIYNENIQVELARALTSVILEETTCDSNSYCQSLIMELKGLRIQYPKNDKLAAIHQTVSPLIKD
jgi:hypothetical protein